MSRLFELLITRLMAEAKSEIRVKAQQSSQLDIGGLLTIRPDLEILSRQDGGWRCRGCSGSIANWSR